jgi:hypothetical protein
MKMNFLVLAGMALTFGLVLSGCGEKCPGGGCSVESVYNPISYKYKTEGITCGSSKCAAHKAKENNTSPQICDCEK